MKKLLMLPLYVLFLSVSVKAMHGLPFKHIDELPKFCRAFADRRGIREVCESAVSVINGSMKVAAIKNTDEDFVFKYFVLLVKAFLDKTHRCDVQGVEFETACTRALKSLKSGWRVVDIKEAEQDCLVLEKGQSTLTQGLVTYELEPDDALIGHLIEMFGLEEKVGFDMSFMRRGHGDRQYRYLYIRKDAWEEFQSRFGFVIPELQTQQTVSGWIAAAATAIGRFINCIITMSAPVGPVQQTPLHEVAAAAQAAQAGRQMGGASSQIDKFA